MRRDGAGLVLPAALFYLLALAITVASLSRSGVFEKVMAGLELQRLQERHAMEAALDQLTAALDDIDSESAPEATLCTPGACALDTLPALEGLAVGVSADITVGSVLPQVAGLKLGGSSLRGWHYRAVKLRVSPSDSGRSGIDEQWWIRVPASH